MHFSAFRPTPLKVTEVKLECMYWILSVAHRTYFLGIQNRVAIRGLEWARGVYGRGRLMARLKFGSIMLLLLVKGKNPKAYAAILAD